MNKSESEHEDESESEADENIRICYSEYVILGLVDAQIIYEDVYAIHDVYK